MKTIVEEEFRKPLNAWQKLPRSWELNDNEYLWAYIHWLEDWIKSLSERVRDLEKVKT